MDNQGKGIRKQRVFYIKQGNPRGLRQRSEAGYRDNMIMPSFEAGQLTIVVCHTPSPQGRQILPLARSTGWGTAGKESVGEG